MGFLSGLLDPVIGIAKDVMGFLAPAAQVAAPFMPVASAYMAQQGQEGANETNLQIAREATAFNSAEAATNRNFQYDQITS